MCSYVSYVSYNGTTNSFIEEYMKIVDVLNQTSEAPFRNEKSKTKVTDIFTGGSLLSGSKITNHIKLRFFAQRTNLPNHSVQSIF